MEMEMDSTIGSRLSLREKNGSVLPFLPDEIISNILSRLSVKFVIRCRLVCKRWRDLTLNRDFVDLNFKDSLPLILAADFHYGDDVCYLHLLDKWWGPSRSRMIHRFPFHLTPCMIYPLFSQGGLIVRELRKSGSNTILCIVNPIYPAQNVRITLSRVMHDSEIYGVFFHPSLKEYCSLWKIKTSDKQWCYMILTLGSNPSLRTLAVSNLLLDRVKKPTTHLFLIGNYLYWMLDCPRNRWTGCNDIMKFDITSEEFTLILCPVPLNIDCNFNQTHVLDIDGILSFLLVFPCKITIWSLNDHKEQVWTRSEYNINFENCSIGFIRPIAVVNGKLALMWDGTLYICNLVEGKCQKRKQYGQCVNLSHQTSLASLSNCMPMLSIDRDQDNKVVVAVEENEMSQTLLQD